MVSSLLRPDGTVQTTSQVTLDQFPNFINGNEVQLFVQTHGVVHLRNVQAHSSSRSIRAMQDQATARRSRSPVPRRPELGLRMDHMDNQKMKMTGVNGPFWTLRTHDDRRRPRSPSVPPVRQMASDTVDLIPLPVRNPVPSLGSHRFVLRSGSRIEEIAIMIDDASLYCGASLS